MYASATEKPDSRKLVEEHGPLVRRIAYHLLARLPSSVNVDDLVQSGMIGLLEAAANYDAAKGASFETYAGIRIRGAMIDEVRRGDWSPRSVHRNARRVVAGIRNVELRSGGEPATVLATRSALVQRDGDVVASDGLNPVSFPVAPGNYHVAIRHRNHLGAMTATPVALSAAATTVDFRLASLATYGTEARKTIAGAFPAEALWAGDVTFNSMLQYLSLIHISEPTRPY